MAGSLVKTQAWKSSLWHLRSMHTSAACSKHFAARVRVSKGTKAVTYEEFNPPHQIAHRKGWLSQHTSNLDGEEGAAKRTLEDVFIRRFMYGTFHGCLATPPVIKRRANILIICAIIIRRIPPFNSHTSLDKVYIKKRRKKGVFPRLLKVGPPRSVRTPTWRVVVSATFENGESVDMLIVKLVT
uniref:Mitochondrial ribosomal protein S24 n=1 Tax=Eptatretus burgeri TaxID=7764 RepID=A0A8C4R5F0_EPTBU